MKPSIWTSMFHPMSGVDQLPEVAAAGFEYAELSCEAVVDPEEQQITEAHAERLCQASEQAGVRLRQVHFPILTLYPGAARPDGKFYSGLLTDFAHPDPERREFELRCAEKLLSLCPRMGIEVMVVHPGGPDGWETPEELARLDTLNLEALRRLAPVAARHNVIIAVENMAWVGDRVSYGATIEQLAGLVDAVHSPHVGICFDTSHANWMRVDLPAAIRQLGARIVATHLSDNQGTHDDHLFPYSGRICWREVVRALREIGYARLFNLETPGENRCPLEVLRLKTRHARQLLALLLGEE